VKQIIRMACFLVCAMAISPYSDKPDFAQIQSIPEWVSKTFAEKSLADTYQFSTKLNPFYIRGDFDGDLQADVAILIVQKSSKKCGIAVFHYSTKSVFLLGAGEAFGSGGDDFRWMDVWHVFRKGPVRQGVDAGPPPILTAEAIYVGKSESASALIYWDGKDYVWYQQAD
jgi:hypothetical protein